MSDDSAGIAAALQLGAPYHIGIAVHDLDAAMRTYGAAFGIREWRVREIPSFRPSTLWHGKPQPGIGLRYAYSVTELPILELLQPTTDVEWSATAHLREHGEGIYHVGYWVDDVRAAMAQAAACGIEAELVSLDDRADGPPRGIAYLAPRNAHGLRIELVSASNRERTLHLIRTGEDLRA